MFRPSSLFLMLLVLGVGLSMVLWYEGAPKPVPPTVVVKHAPREEPVPPPAEPMVANPLLPMPENTTKGSDADKQIALLQNQVEYLHEQVQALQKENSELIDKLAKLGLPSNGKPMKVESPPDKVPADYVSLGGELLALRELEELPIPTVTAPQADIEKLILAWIKRQHPANFGEREGAAYAALGVIPQMIDTLPLRASLWVRQLGGWYDDQSETIYVVDPEEQPDGVPVMSDPSLALSYANLLHHFGKSLLPGAKVTLTTDERMARLGLLGGDAALVRFLRDLKEFQGPNPHAIPTDDPDHPLNLVPMPAYLRELETFPMMSGFRFAQAMHSIGGFKQLSSVYGRAPESTADVMDSQRYLAEDRLPIPRIEWASTEVAKSKPFWDDRLGQQAVLTFLRRYHDDQSALDASRGWASDRLLTYAINGDLSRRGHAVWQTQWKTPEQAAAFVKSLRECLRQFYDQGSASEAFVAQGRAIRTLVLKDKVSVLMIDAATDEFAKAAMATFVN
jgi:hypothetical protein